MGKAQSKRSVDITTETKKGAENEITEKMEKIEDVDKKEVVNGDAAVQEKNVTEQDNTEVESDKDMTTGDSLEFQTTDKAKESGSVTAEEISPLADESIKKSKKEKVKKKWSFRTISFSKKDKQKPTKNEETGEDGTSATNGATDEKSSTEPEDFKKGKSSVNAIEEKLAENHENGNATQQELNEQQTEENLNDITAKTATTETSVPALNETATESPVSSEKTENVAVLKTIINETKIIEHVTNNEVPSSGNGVAMETNAIEMKPQVVDATESVKISETKNSSTDLINESASINGDVKKIHQNGTFAESEQEIEQPKAQIEVNTNSNKTSAAFLDYSHTSTIPSKVQVHPQKLNASIEKRNDSNVQISDEPVAPKSTEVELESLATIQYTHNETYSMVNIDDNYKIIDTVELLSAETVDTVISSDEKIIEDSPPPLPMSPPPSQVSVFAFTNNEESDSIQNKNSQSFTKTPVEVENEVNLPSEKSGEFSERAVTDSIFKESKTIDNHTTNETKTGDAKFHTDKIIKNDILENEGGNVYIDFLLKNVLSVNCSDESQKREDSFAADVINQIIVKAVEIVNQQPLTINEEFFLQNEQITEKNGFSNKKIAEVNDKMQVRKVEQKVKNDEEFLFEITYSTNESADDPELTRGTCNKSSLQFVATDSIQHVQDEIISLGMSDISHEEHFNPIKEFVNAKDLKDNIAMAEITQDLSVTCE